MTDRAADTALVQPVAPPAAEEHVVTASGGETVHIRLATPADEPELQRFFASVTMDADLQMSVRRAPSLLELYRMQCVQWECWIGLIEGEVVGMGTLLAGDGWIGGEPVRLGYLGDLRLDRRVRGRTVLTAMYGPVLDGFAARNGIDVFLTAVIATNRAAVAGLTSPKARELGIPEYHLLTEFDIRAVQLLQPRRALRPPAGVEVRCATDGDVGGIAALLDADGRAKPFGYRLDEATLRERIAAWPSLQTASFRIALQGGEVVGVLAPWDASAVRQTVIEGYRGSMRRVQRAYNLAAHAFRAEPLPRAGERLHYLYGTHNAVAGDDPAIQAALLRACYRDLRRSGNVFLSCYVPTDDPLAAACRGYVKSDLHAHLYAVVPHGKELPDAMRTAGRARFEMALA